MTRARTGTKLLEDTGGILLAFLALLTAETAWMLLAHGQELVAGWEIGRVLVVWPVALSAAIPAAIALAALGLLALAPLRLRVAASAAIGAGAGLALALGVSTGRHFERGSVRMAFAVALGLVAAAAAVVLGRVLVRMPAKPRLALAFGGALVSWLVDHFVLVRLYPAFHLALLAVAMAAAALAWSGVRSARVGMTGLVLAFAAMAAAPPAARLLATSDNVRTALLEHTPWLGRGVMAAARLAPPAPLDETAEEPVTAPKPSGPRTLDWSGRDIVLVTIDALRADHVGAYGYRRATTPNIDALAARGVRFDHAYCPTPHTSYSVASLMTGKYMRPLLAVGDEGDHETWAAQLRRYGYRTAAFYPPAVFFIDEHKFERLRAAHLGFEYQKVEFADPALRAAQVKQYLEAPEASGRPLFLWVHAFEPHEPYVRHPEHPFAGDERFDAYDSEIAAADALVGDVVRLVESRRPGAVVIVTADHGEEFGEHGGRYHGTTVYEEQVRVPLVLVAPGLAPRVVKPPVQTIDLLPTVLSALDIPRSARIRGRDLGAAMTGGGTDDQGLAFAETDDFTLLARGSDRLVCARKIGACSLYDVDEDPGEHRPVTGRPERIAALKKEAARLARENGRVEAPTMPAALRRCFQGDRDIAEDVAILFDDARVEIRRAAARCAFELRAPELAPQLLRAVRGGDTDAAVRTWSALARAWTDDAEHVDSHPPDDVVRALDDADPDVRVAAARVLAWFRDPRGERILVAAWPSVARNGELDQARALLESFTSLHSRAAVPVLLKTLDDVRLRVHVVDALGAIRDERARPPLLELFVHERYVNARDREADVLADLGERSDVFRRALARFAGVPEPNPRMFQTAAREDLLGRSGARETGAGKGPLEVTLEPSGDGPHRLWIATNDAPTVVVDGVERAATEVGPRCHVVELDDVRGPTRVRVTGRSPVDVWLVRRSDDIPPPPPEAWDAGTEDTSAR